MGYDVVSFDTGGDDDSKRLFTTHINQIGDNFFALASQDSGTPAWDVSSMIVDVASIRETQNASSFVSPQVSSMGRVDVQSGFVGGTAFESLYSVNIVNPVSHYTIDDSEADGRSIFCNHEATEQITFTLPASGTGGKKAIFISTAETNSFGLKITAQGSDLIYKPTATNSVLVSCIEMTYNAKGESSIMVTDNAGNWIIVYEREN